MYLFIGLFGFNVDLYMEAKSIKGSKSSINQFRWTHHWLGRAVSILAHTMAPRRGSRALKLLALSDVGGELQRVNQLCERVVSSADCDVDVVLVSGGLVAPRGACEYEALEAVGCAEGDMTALVSRIEMITCRVVYIPDDVSACRMRGLSEAWQLAGWLAGWPERRWFARRLGTNTRPLAQNDPPTTRSQALAPPTLTQYSINVHNRGEKIAPGVVAMGDSHFFKCVTAIRLEMTARLLADGALPGRMVFDGKDPLEDAELALVLRDSSVRSQLPARRTYAPWWSRWWDWLAFYANSLGLPVLLSLLPLNLAAFAVRFCR